MQTEKLIKYDLLIEMSQPNLLTNVLAEKNGSAASKNTTVKEVYTVFTHIHAYTHIPLGGCFGSPGMPTPAEVSKKLSMMNHELSSFS